MLILIDLFLEQMNTIILKLFERNATIILKKEKFIIILVMIWMISPRCDEDILDKIQIKKNSDEEDSKEEEDSDEKK